MTKLSVLRDMNDLYSLYICARSHDWEPTRWNVKEVPRKTFDECGVTRARAAHREKWSVCVCVCARCLMCIHGSLGLAECKQEGADAAHTPQQERVRATSVHDQLQTLGREIYILVCKCAQHSEIFCPGRKCVSAFCLLSREIVFDVLVHAPPPPSRALCCFHAAPFIFAHFTSSQTSFGTKHVYIEVSQLYITSAMKNVYYIFSLSLIY